MGRVSLAVAEKVPEVHSGSRPAVGWSPSYCHAMCSVPSCCAEALIQIPGCVGSTSVDGIDKLTAWVGGSDWHLCCRAAKCPVILKPDSMVKILLGWLSGNTEQMPIDADVTAKDVRIEACLLLGQLRSSRNDVVKDELLKSMHNCMRDIDIPTSS